MQQRQSKTPLFVCKRTTKRKCTNWNVDHLPRVADLSNQTLAITPPQQHFPTICIMLHTPWGVKVHIFQWPKLERPGSHPGSPKSMVNTRFTPLPIAVLSPSFSCKAQLVGYSKRSILSSHCVLKPSALFYPLGQPVKAFPHYLIPVPLATGLAVLWTISLSTAEFLTQFNDILSYQQPVLQSLSHESPWRRNISFFIAAAATDNKSCLLYNILR